VVAVFKGHRNTDDPPIARNTDPETSHRAEYQYTLTNRAIRQRQVLYLVSEYPERTNGEYARLMLKVFKHLPIKTCCESPHKRLSDLKEKGLIWVTGERKCRDSGYECSTWALTKKGRREMRTVHIEDLR
jgi:hypothetical protein